MRKKGRFSTFILLFILLAGLSLLLYPTFANYWNSFRATISIADYSVQVADLGEEEYQRLWQEAVDYNRSIMSRKGKYSLSEEERAKYNSVLDVSGTGIMGYIEIPAIDVEIPIYHGTDAGVLQIGVGHLDWTSLPVGGESSHCALSGHRGLPSAQLFTRLNEIYEGDIFKLHVLDQVLAYEVDQILIVEPDVISDLKIVEGKDYCTLVTCTPYAINTHRLLVRGHRIENLEDAASINIIAEAVLIDPLIASYVLGIPAILLLLILVFLGGIKKGKAASPGAKSASMKPPLKE